MRKTITILVVLLLGLIIAQSTIAQKPAILPMRERAAVVNNWLKIRLDEILPDLMDRTNLDMWIVICREYNEDPVYLTLVPEPTFAARRLTMLVFFNKGKGEVERLTVSRYGMGEWYKGVWNPDEMGQWECLAKVVKDRNPKRIGINVSDTFAFGDGLTASFKSKLVDAVGKKYADRLVSAENLCVGWLEIRTEAELEVYHHITDIAHEIIEEAFSNRVITPGVTTALDVRWWMRQKIRDLGMTTWFQPSVSIQRQGIKRGEGPSPRVIHRGDLLHCDMGIVYLRLNTDTQELAYVLKEGESDAPEGLRKALETGNRLQDIFTNEFVEGRTGNEILLNALSKMKAENIKGSIYTHPLGFHGHAAGPTIGLWDQQRAIPGRGDYKLFTNTAYAIELNVRYNVPEWDNQEVQMGLEQDAVFDGVKVYYLNGRQTKLHIVE